MPEGLSPIRTHVKNQSTLCVWIIFLRLEMNEAELVEAWGLFLGNSQTALGLYLSVLTGYLIIAYLIGDKLTRR